jgi:CheY-like chemotaxis protein
LIDDEHSVMEVSQLLLENLGYQVTGRTDPLGALELFKSEPDRYDLVLTDLTMPNLTGDQLARMIKSIRPSVPVILCTGFDEKLNGCEAAAEVDAAMMKPLDQSEIAEALRRQLDRAKKKF